MESQLYLVLNVLLAGAFGGLVGAEREIRSRPAGLRTHILVACAAALFVSLGDVMVDRVTSEAVGGQIRADPLRILQAIAAGVSFIGAGAILFRRGRDQVEGLTTAGSILVTAAIGVATALRLYLAAGLITVFVVGVLYGLTRLDALIQRRSSDADETA